jgi:hypothetical protein
MSREAPTLDELYGEGAEAADCGLHCGQQLYAEIKRTSEYAHQAGPLELFPVNVEPGDPCGYVVYGGPGGQYRICDVSFWVIENGHKLKLGD